MALKASMSILLVEENANMRQTVKKLLSDIGFKNITEASDGNKAWELVDNGSNGDNPIQFVLCDATIPKLNGIDLLKKMRADARFAKLPFLMMTGESDQQNVIHAIKAGANNIIVKPFSADGLQEKLVQIFQKKKG